MKTLKWVTVFIVLVSVGVCRRANGQTLSTLFSFFGVTNGANPVAELVQNSDGYFYGTTLVGGTNGTKGTVFRISSDGGFTNLHSFSGADGASPWAGLLQDKDGNLYGTTAYGGVTGSGTVFRITPSGSLTNLHSFSGSDGSVPTVGLVQGSDDNFYGTTFKGGTSDTGTVFRISTNGDFTNLYSFGGADGALPFGRLAQGSDGNFYGTTAYGGALGSGTVFRITPTGSLTNLYSFGSNLNDGANPNAALVRGIDGVFYGTTYYGGAIGSGSVFRVTPSGNFTNLYSFSGIDGANPYAGLVQGSDGNFYGTTENGGAYDYGIIFRISPTASFTNLHSFNRLDGAYTTAALVQGSDGNFYGTTWLAGKGVNGTVFKFVVPLNPPANQISAVQIADNNVAISIPTVAGETYQLQFSSSMSLTNWSNVVGASVTNSLGAMLTLTNLGGALSPQGFYRFTITP